MISHRVADNHLARFYDLSHLIKDLVVDTDRDPKATSAIQLVVAEWKSWCRNLELLFPNMNTESQTERLFDASSRDTSDPVKPISERFEQTNELVRRLMLIHGVE